MPVTFYATNNFTGNGTTTTWNINFADGYLSTADVKARYVDNTGAFVDIAITSVVGNVVTISPAQPAGRVFSIYRDTQKSQPLVDFADGAILNETNLDVLATQAVMVAAEASDLANGLVGVSYGAQADADAALAASSSAAASAAAAQVSAAAAQSAATAAQTSAGNAVATANTANSNASAAVSTANTANTNASTALTTANNASTTANTALTTANSANSTAGTALSTANTASTNASNAVTTANSANSTASTANTNATNAVSTANNALSVANGIDAKATTALNNSNNAVTTANAAAATANAIDGKAQTALDNSNSAVTTANAASTTANNAAAAVAGKADLASPVFTGDPKAPTPATSDNDTSIATTAFVKAAIAANPSGFSSIVQKTFVTSQSYTLGANVKFLLVDVIGAGGGAGGQASSAPAAGSIKVMPPGSRGAHIRVLIDLVAAGLVGSTVSITVSAGGGGTTGTGSTGGSTLVSIGAKSISAGGGAGGNGGGFMTLSSFPAQFSFTNAQPSFSINGFTAGTYSVLPDLWDNRAGSVAGIWLAAAQTDSAVLDTQGLSTEYGNAAIKTVISNQPVGAGYGYGGCLVAQNSSFPTVTGGSGGAGAAFITEYS